MTTETKPRILVVNDTTLPRFMGFVSPEPTSGCWLWTGRGIQSTTDRTHNEPYGAFTMGRVVRAHRAAWMLFRGPIPVGTLICHHCDNPGCVNPDHLYVGTSIVNARDKMVRGRFVDVQGCKTHCPHGHPYSEENTAIVKAEVPRWCGRGLGRHCRTCDRERKRGTYHARKGALHA